MAGYVTDELNLVAPAVGNGDGGSLWTYINSAEDSAATIRGAGYFSNGVRKGLRVGDYIISCTTAGVGLLYKVDSVSGDAATVT